VYRCNVFVPGHITGFFCVPSPHPDRKKTGSKGGGVCVDRGVLADVTLYEEAGGVALSVDGEEKHLPVVELAVGGVLGENRYGVAVDVVNGLPPGQGFGMSGAIALASAKGTYHILHQMGVEPAMDPVEAAHLAEVTLGTGLGDVIAQAVGGAVARKKEGVPPWGETVKSEETGKILALVVGPPLETKSVLASGEAINVINSVAERFVDSFAVSPSINRLFDISVRFTDAIKRTIKVDDNTLRVMEGLSKKTDVAMVMLGNALWAPHSDRNEGIFTDVASEMGLAPPMVLGVDTRGARVLDENDKNSGAEIGTPEPDIYGGE